jgi:uncharacterized repeat protein (TIGR01451 family)
MMKQFGMLLLLATCAVAFPQSLRAESTVAWVDLSLRLETATPTPSPGDLIEVELILRNDGGFSTEEVEVALLIPEGLTMVSQTPRVGSYDADQNLWILGSIDSYSATDLQMTLMVDPDAVAQLSLVAEVQSVTTSFGASDYDSTPGNGDPCEDDYDSLPLEIVGGRVLDAGTGDEPDPCAQPPGPDAGGIGPNPGGPDGGMSEESSSSSGCRVADRQAQSWPLLALAFLFYGYRRRASTRCGGR